MLTPSYVLVPLPISSRTTRLYFVALLTIFAASSISTIKVLLPLAKSSDAPTLVNTLSTIDNSILFAGTKLPI